MECLGFRRTKETSVRKNLKINWFILNPIMSSLTCQHPLCSLHCYIYLNSCLPESPKVVAAVIIFKCLQVGCSL